MNDQIMAALRALYIEGTQAGVELASDIAGQHCRQAGDRAWAHRERIADDAGEFFDGEDSEEPEWPALRQVLEAIRSAEP